MAVFQFNAPDADMDRWKADADRLGVSFAAYIRALLNQNFSAILPPVETVNLTVSETVDPASPAPTRPTIQKDPYSFPASSGKRSFRPDPK